MGVRLGSFDLIEPIARGGMGEVWSAIHRHSRLEVAVKVITADYARHPGFVASLRHEVRAMASLSHPGIVRVLDQGEIDGAAAAQSDHRLVRGSPFIAMEWVRGGTLADHILELPWEDVREILLQLLSALAHAHSRDVLHRDLKPANILLPTPSNTWAIKLTDFGISQPLHSDELVGPRMAGTPLFMAPEQAQGDWRDYRPATDLFSVGRIANALLARDADGGAMVPKGFTAWVGTLLADLPQHRFAFAADAATALAALGRPEVRVIDDIALDAANRPTELHMEPGPAVPLSSAERRPRIGRFGTAIPESWHDPAVAGEHAPPLTNAGAGLLGIRTPDLVGRVHERNVLWNTLRRTHQTRRAHLVTLRGPEGIGKRALATWLRQRAYECGVAWPHHAAFDPTENGLDALRLILAREFKTQGLDHAAARPRVERLARLYGTTDSYDLDALAEAANPKGDHEPGFRFGSIRERTRLLARFLHWAAAERPVIVHLEDLQWSASAIALIQAFWELDAENPVPLLFVVTIEQRALATCFQEREAIRALVKAAGKRCVDMLLPPLPPDNQRALIAALLGLDPSFVARLADQTEGNPLHAIQRVTELHELGRLVAGPHGLLPRDAADETQPVDVIWRHRLESFLSHRSDNSRISVELLAVYGRTVPHQNWIRLARRAGVAPSQHLVDTLVGAGLLRMDGDLYTFTHPTLRQAVLDLAERAGRLQGHHGNCADLLLRYAQGGDRAGRIGEHLLLAGRTEAALEHLEEGAQQAFTDGLVHRVGELVERWLEALAQLDLPADDPRHGNGQSLEAQLALTANEPRHAMRAAEKLLQNAKRFGWHQHEVAAVHHLGRAHYVAGRHDKAIEGLEQALALADRHAPCPRRSEILFDLARTWIHWGDVEKTIRYTSEARPLFLAEKNRKGERLCILLAASAAFHVGRPDEALSLAGTAKVLAEEQGSLHGQAEALTMAGEVHRSVGRFDKAETAYRLARKMILSSSGPSKSLIIEMNLASALAAKGEHNEALNLLMPAIQRLHRLGRHGLEAVAHCLCLPSMAATANEVGFNRHLAASTALLEQARTRETDAITALEDASRRARALGWNDASAMSAALAMKMDTWR